MALLPASHQGRLRVVCVCVCVCAHMGEYQKLKHTIYSLLNHHNHNITHTDVAMTAL